MLSYSILCILYTRYDGCTIVIAMAVLFMCINYYFNINIVDVKGCANVNAHEQYYGTRACSRSHRRRHARA